MPTPPGFKVWENTAALSIGSPAALTGWYDTTGYTTLLVAAAITNGGGGSTTFTVEGSYDGSTLDSTLTYGTSITSSTAAAGSSYTVQHTYVRFRVVVAVANATTSTFYVQSKA
jgi:hypothetical protein